MSWLSHGSVGFTIATSAGPRDGQRPRRNLFSATTTVSCTAPMPRPFTCAASTLKSTSCFGVGPHFASADEAPTAAPGELPASADEAPTAAPGKLPASADEAPTAAPGKPPST